MLIGDQVTLTQQARKGRTEIMQEARGHVVTNRNEHGRVGVQWNVQLDQVWHEKLGDLIVISSAEIVP